MHLARDSSVLVMFLVLETLSNLPLQKLGKDCSELVKMLKDSDRDVRQAALDALSKLPHEDLTKHLPLLLKTLRA